MATIKRFFFIWFHTIICLIIVFASCKHTSDNTEVYSPEATFAQPLIQPLKFGSAKKIDWGTVKSINVKPVIKKLNWDKLPQRRYDTSDFKPFKYPVEETKFDFNSLPSKDFDIDKLPSHPLKFKTYILPPPKLIKGAKPQLKNGNLFLFGFGEDQKAAGIQVDQLLNDHDGLLWIATTQGIYRYDGESLLLFLAYSDQKFNHGMLQDREGNIWIGDVNGGMEVLNPKGGTLKKSTIGQGILGTGTRRLMQDKQQRIWVTGWSGGVNIIDPKTQTVKYLDKAHGLSASLGSDGIVSDQNDNIWIGTFGSGVYIIDIRHQKIKHLDKAHGLKSDILQKIICDHTGRLCLGLIGGLIDVVDLQKNSIQTIREAQSPAPDMFVPALLQDRKGRIWIGTIGNGIEIIDPERRTTMHLGENDGLSSDIVQDINQDAAGQVWIATNTGLNMITNNQAVVEQIGKDSINSSVEDYQGLVWMATPHGVDILDRKKRTSRHLSIKQGIVNDNIHYINEINGNVFITTDSGMDIIDKTRGTVAHLDRKQGLSTDRPGTMLVDKKRQIWIASFNNAIDVYDPQNKTLKHLRKAQGLDDDPDGILCQDRQGQIWVSLLNGGADKIDLNTGTIQYLNNVPGLKSNGFKIILPDNKGNIWIGTDNGIYIADMNTQKLISFSVLQGLINNKILSLQQYGGLVYAGTNQGITVITPATTGLSSDKKWRVWSYGLIKKDIDNYGYDLITKDGLYWSRDLGITVLHLAEKDAFKSVPYIAGISIYDHPKYFLDRSRLNSSIKDTLWEINEKKYYLKGETPVNASNALESSLTWDTVTGPGNMPINLQVPFDQNFIRFHYGSFNLTPHDTTMYRYFLVGADKKWSDITNESSTNNYMNLQPGDYTFEVISRDANNIWSSPAKFSFIVTPPWWQTHGAYLLYLCLFAVTVWCFVYYRSRQLIKDKRILEHQVQIRTEEVLQQKEEIEAQRDKLEMEKIRSDIAADFHDELGSTLSSIALYSEMAITDSSADERTKSILSLIGESSRGTVSAMQDMIWTIQPKNDSMQEVIYRMREYAYPLAELKNITLTLAAAEDVRAMVLSMEVRKNIYLIFKEALNNAFKYAAASAIGIKLVKQYNVLKLEIRDDGAGFDVSNARAGNGLINMRKRAEQVGGTLLVTSAKGNGTEILFSCPVA